MIISRRNFIKSNTMALAGSAFLPALVSAAGKKADHILGVQLYSVRDDMHKDPVTTLKQLRAAGFEYVEHAGYENRKFYGFTPGDFKKLLNDIGLRMETGHSSLEAKQWDKSKNDFTDEWKYTIEDSAAVGLKYVISPGVDESVCGTMEEFSSYLDIMNRSGELCKKHGLIFAYHSESYEFNHELNNTRLYDLLLKLTDQSLVAQQIDIGNMYAPGGRALDYLKKYPGRFKLMHVKDVTKRQNGSGYVNITLGKGVVGVKEIVDYALKTGTKYFIIEHNSYVEKSPMECVTEDLKVMKQWGF